VNIGWSELALEQLRAAYDYVAIDNAMATERMVERIFSAVEFLEQHPNLGRPGRVEGTRELVVTRTPFVIAYRLQRNHLQILAVLHAARKWPKAF